MGIKEKSMQHILAVQKLSIEFNIKIYSPSFLLLSCPEGNNLPPGMKKQPSTSATLYLLSELESSNNVQLYINMIRIDDHLFYNPFHQSLFIFQCSQR